MGGRVQLLLVLAGQVRLDVEDHFLERMIEKCQAGMTARWMTAW